jgi:hypothetical protein
MTLLADSIERIEYESFDEQVIFKPTPLRLTQRERLRGANTYTYPDEPVGTDDNFKIKAILQYNDTDARYRARIYTENFPERMNVRYNEMCNIFDRSLKTKTVKTIKKIKFFVIPVIVLILIILFILMYTFELLVWTIFTVFLSALLVALKRIFPYPSINILYEKQITQYNVEVFYVLSSVLEALNTEKKESIGEKITNADKNIHDHSDTNNMILGYLSSNNDSNSVINAVLLAYLKYDHRSGCRELSTSKLEKLRIRIYKDARKYLAFSEPEPVRVRSRPGIQSVHVKPRPIPNNNDPDQAWLNVDQAR